MLLNIYWVNEEIKGEIKNYLKTNGNENMTYQPIGYSKSCTKMEVYCNTGIPQETRKISNKQPNITSKETRKRRTNKAQN